MEFSAGGELFDYIVKHQRLSEKQACKFYQELISGIEYLHKSGVCHRDLKPENLLLDYDKTLKIVDFGLSNMYERGETLKTACGSPCYAAPEMIAGKRYNGLQTDIWSSGVVLYAMICGYLPFEDPKTSQLYKKILSADYQIPKFVSNEGRDMLTRILNTDPEERATIATIRQHPWFKQVSLPTDREPGLYPGLQKMPYNNDLLRQIVEEYDFESDYSIKCLEANRHNHITATYHLINKRNKRALALKESVQPNQFNVTQTNYHSGKSTVDSAQMPNRGGRHSRKKFIDPLNQTMPIGTALANNLKVNNMMIGGGTGPANSTITSPDGGHHHRDMSLDDERGNRRQNINTAGFSNGTANKAEIIASRIVNQSKSPDRYVIGNNLVVNLNGANSPVGAGGIDLAN